MPKQITIPVAIVLLVLLFTNCKKNADLSFEITGISTQNYPVVDGSTSTSPLQNLVACKLLGIPYEWHARLEFDNVWYLGPKYGQIPTGFNYSQRILTSTTHGSFLNLIDKKADYILAARTMSDDEKTYANQKSVALTETPIALDAFIFIINSKNPVKNLTTQQIRNIYTSKITNWKEVGGNDAPIKPYMRNRNSGSQEKMEKLVMQGLTMDDFPLDMESSMMGAFDAIRADENGICYTVYYYKEQMARTSWAKHIAVDGVYPDKSTIINKSYPYVTNVYSVIRTDLDKNSMPHKIYDLMLTPAGKRVITESGYIPN